MEYIQPKRVLITGGAGFIGSHIAEHWLSQDVEVVILDNLRTGSLDNIKQLQGVKFIQGSITDKDIVFELLEGVDIIHHLAAMVSVPESVHHPEECVEINVLGLLNVLKGAVKHNVKKIVFSSSAAVYGDTNELPLKITASKNPLSPYGLTKLDGEYYLKIYEAEFGLKGVSLRYFNVYGPRQNPKSQYASAIPIFVTRALNNEDITIFGDGEQTRDFIYVKDIVRANVLAGTSQISGKVFNVATGNTGTVNDLARTIVQITGSKSSIVHVPERAGDIKYSSADVSETERELQFNIETDLITGLTATIKNY